MDERITAGNSTYKKLAVQWVSEVLCFVSSFMLADGFRLRNRQLLVAAKRYESFLQTIKNKYLGLLFPLLLFSCQANTDKQINASQKKIISPNVNDEFTLYLDNFKKLDLPIIIKGCNISSSDFKQFDGKQFSKYSIEYSLAYGQIPTNGNYVATITLDPADCYLPVLTTYKLTGQIIDKKTIAIGGCGSDCGFSCKEFMALKKDFSFFTSDTISTYTCDSLGNETPGTYEYYVIYKKGKLHTDGKIEMNEEIKQSLKVRKMSHNNGN